MAYQIPDSVPSSLVAGDSWQWRASFADYPPGDGWSLAYVFTANGSDPVTVTAATDATVSSAFLCTVPAATTATMAATEWYWTALATKASERHVAESGRFTVSPDPATFTGDPRSKVKRILDAIDAAILNASSTHEGSISVESVTLSYRNLDELRRHRAAYAAMYRREVSAENAKRGFRKSSAVFTRFTRPN